MISRTQALAALEMLSADAYRRLCAGDSGAVDLVMLDRSAHDQQLDPVMTTCTAARQRVRLAQLWVVIAALHSHLNAGKKLAQRELWYRLKPLRLFDSSAQVYERILQVCAVISAWCGVPCPREALGVIAAPRGSMTGTVTLSNLDGQQPLDGAVYAIPGDPEACCAITFAESRARYVVVVEKDTVFTRLVQDGFIRHLPCVLITACGFPSLAVRALVQHVVKALSLPCVVLTDYNPHGMALMLTYKYGSTSFAFDGYCCPELIWVGLHTADVLRLERPPDQVVGAPVGSARPMLSSANLQPFGGRDRSVMEGLLRRQVVMEDEALRSEAEAMHADGRKLELEALHTLGLDFFTLFLRDKIMRSA